MLVLVILSMMLFLAFNMVGIYRYGFLDCYSRYGMKWAAVTNNTNINIWSFVTIVTAMLLIPPVIETGEGSMLQCLCFFAPLNLFVVGLTPDYASSHKKYIFHSISAFVSGLMITIWGVFILNYISLLIIIVLCMLLVAVLVSLSHGSSNMLSELKAHWLYYVELVFYIFAYLGIASYFIN